MRALRTPVGTLGFVTSKDAWMLGVTSQLDEEGVDLLVQPEFFAGDTLSGDAWGDERDGPPQIFAVSAPQRARAGRRVRAFAG